MECINCISDSSSQNSITEIMLVFYMHASALNFFHELNAGTLWTRLFFSFKLWTYCTRSSPSFCRCLLSRDDLATHWVHSGQRQRCSTAGQPWLGLPRCWCWRAFVVCPSSRMFSERWLEKSESKLSCCTIMPCFQATCVWTRCVHHLLYSTLAYKCINVYKQFLRKIIYI